MNKRIKLILIVLVILISSTIIYITYNYFRIKNAKIEVELKDDLVLEFNDKKHVSDFIEKINGKISNDYIIDSNKLGNKNIKFSFTNNDGIKVKYAFKIKVVDTIAPVIWLGNNYNLEKGSDVVLTDKILCGDNYDNKPNCFIEGDYDINTPGTYPLTFKAIDSSGNAESKSFNLNVYEPIKTETKEDNKETTKEPEKEDENKESEEAETNIPVNEEKSAENTDTADTDDKQQNSSAVSTDDEASNAEINGDKSDNTADSEIPDKTENHTVDEILRSFESTFMSEEEADKKIEDFSKSVSDSQPAPDFTAKIHNHNNSQDKSGKTCGCERCRCQNGGRMQEKGGQKPN